MRQRRHVALVLVLTGLFVVTAAIVGSTQAHYEQIPPYAPLSSLKPLLDPSKGASAEEPPVEIEQDTCLHCHLTGSIENIWTPVWRWAVFGLAGIVFVFGAYQSGTVWITRKKWQPLWARAVSWLDDRYEIVEPIKKILSKPVPLFSTRWMYCLGGITFTLFLIQALTGTLLAFYYKPTPEAAYESILFIENEVLFGAAIRTIHHWAANAMVVLVVAHMLRVFIHGAFKPPRELNWVSGVFLFIITMAFGLTGYLLPWDQRAYWATTVATEIAGAVPQIGDIILVFLRGGWDVTGITLSRFYAVHMLALPVVIIAVLGAHFLMVRRQGISKPL
jgi:hypothetical protein